MTYEEAIYQLTNFEGTYETPSLEAIELAIETLEKQIPKKPINEPGSLMGEKFDQYFCPSCYEKRVELHTPHTCMMDYNVTERMHCCPLCGQAIDWSD
ncbi:MAG: hypothetical protein KBS82_05005 [Oscillospiraceae bacterium]|nr:hypothetical protein [Candidatus Limimonas egerieequi]